MPVRAPIPPRVPPPRHARPAPPAPAPPPHWSSSPAPAPASPPPYTPHGPYAPHGPHDPHDPHTPRTSLSPEQLAQDRPPEGGRAAVRRAARDRSRARRAAQRPEVLRRLVPQALVVAFLAGGTSAFVAYDKEVELTVDGTPRTLHTFADDVGELLAEEDLDLGAHDSVGPSPRRQLADGDEISFSHGRPLDLTLDGTRRRVWTTERTVHDALRRMGVRTRGAALSLAPSADIPRTGLTLEVRTQRTVTFLADGHEKSVRTNAGSVLEALTEAGIELDGLDTTSAPMDSFPRDGQTVTVMRITGSEKVKEERIPFKTVRHADPGLPEGTEVVARAGRTGLRRVTYRLRTVNGVREKPRRIAVEVLRRPRKQIVRVGTLPLSRSVPGADHLDWTALARCESGGRPRAVDSSGRHGGLYQLDAPTWRSLGGGGRPQEATAQEQTYRAKKLYVSKGASPWPYCGRKLSR
ncbi:ubiquitin-like domain-containing protein [Streptomyces sp. M600PL45_2]|uniref:Ubiquitin-like domain-containing protein n=1 Tax=Streptomyces marispadix TaxID=2922868 RepID=A0ABS9SWS1_9ACTN|nr:resuscitation-promoting factor [Streptomyces marispadix]MCH6160740.1 ubiquitin-like domain-containing protein [Streptomyces marispadix]